MVNFYRVVCSFVLLISALPAFASFPAVPADSSPTCSPSLYPNPYPSSPASWICGIQPSGANMCGWREPSGYTGWQCTIPVGTSTCPAGATKAGESCTCNTGFVEVNGQCKGKKSDKCGDLEGHSLGLSLLEISVGVASTGALVGMAEIRPGGCLGSDATHARLEGTDPL